MKLSEQILILARELGEKLLQNKLRCAVAESCTGGALAAAITDIPNSSQWFECGFVTYSNNAKQQMLNVPQQLLASNGAVSSAVVCAMAENALKLSTTDISVAISGIAGPSGGTREQPVGTVWLAWARTSQPTKSSMYIFTGDRATIRQQAVEIALKGLLLKTG